MPLVLLVGFAGLLLFNAASKGEHPLCALTRAFGGECPPPPGTTGPVAEAYKQAAGASVIQTPEKPSTSGNRSRGPSRGGPKSNSGRGPLSGGGVKHTPPKPKGKCPPYPNDLVTKGSVTLTRHTMGMLDEAQADLPSGLRILVGNSFRTDEEQLAACRSLGAPGDGSAGVSGKCAPSPGGCSASCHRKGASIDVQNYDNPKVHHALLRAGFCHPLPDSDPVHYTDPHECGRCG